MDPGPNHAPARHVREHRSVLAAAERRALVWIAHRLPRRVNSDHLSALGLLSMVAAGASFAAFPLSAPWAAGALLACLAVNWFGDSLDGTVARVRGHQRPRYGYYVDHAIDLAGSTALLAGLACSGLMSPLLALGLLCAYLLVSAESYLATHAAGVFRMSFLGFGPTELRIVLAVGAMKAAQTPVVDIAGFDAVRLFDVGGGVAISGLIVAFVASAIRNTRALYRAEPLPAHRQRQHSRCEPHEELTWGSAPHPGSVAAHRQRAQDSRCEPHNGARAAENPVAPGEAAPRSAGPSGSSEDGKAAADPAAMRPAPSAVEAS